jgi:hypothetical protein
MLLITIDPNPHLCRVELDGRDITGIVTGIAITAEAGASTSIVTLTLLTQVALQGEPARLEFLKPGEWCARGGQSTDAP